MSKKQEIIKEDVSTTETCSKEESTKSTHNLVDMEQADIQLKDDTEKKLLQEELRSTKADCVKLQERVKHLMADKDNLYKRIRQDVEHSKIQLTRNIMLQILPVKDYLDIGIQCIAPILEQDIEGKNLLYGLSMVQQELLSFLSKYDVKKFDSIGQQFDHHKHHALSRDEDPQKPYDVVTRVMLDGYTMGDTVLRAANVSVNSYVDKNTTETPNDKTNLYKQNNLDISDVEAEPDVLSSSDRS